MTPYDLLMMHVHKAAACDAVKVLAVQSFRAVLDILILAVRFKCPGAYFNKSFSGSCKIDADFCAKNVS